MSTSFMPSKWASLDIKTAPVCKQVAAWTTSASDPGGKYGLHLRISSSDCSMTMTLLRMSSKKPCASNLRAYLSYSEIRMSSATNSQVPSIRFTRSSVLFVFPLLTAATKRLVSIKNLVFLSGKPVCLFLDLFFQPVQVCVFGLLYDILNHGA